MQLDEIGDILRDNRALLEHGNGEQVPVREAAYFHDFASGDDVVAAIPELASDLRREVLVQQEPHPRTARSRFATACSRSAMAA